MQLDIEKMSKAAEKASQAPSKEEAAAAAEGLCGRCADPKAPEVSSAPTGEAIDEPVEEHRDSASARVRAEAG